MTSRLLAFGGGVILVVACAAIAAVAAFAAPVGDLGRAVGLVADTPTSTATSTATPTPTPPNTATPTATNTPEPTPTPEPTDTPVPPTATAPAAQAPRPPANPTTAPGQPPAPPAAPPTGEQVVVAAGGFSPRTPRVGQRVSLTLDVTNRSGPAINGIWMFIEGPLTKFTLVSCGPDCRLETGFLFSNPRLRSGIVIPPGRTQTWRAEVIPLEAGTHTVTVRLRSPETVPLRGPGGNPVVLTDRITVSP
jgi:hypothetical protein